MAEERAVRIQQLQEARAQGPENRAADPLPFRGGGGMGKISHGIANLLRFPRIPFELQFMQVYRPIDTENLKSKTQSCPKSLIFPALKGTFGFSNTLVRHENRRWVDKHLAESRA